MYNYQGLEALRVIDASELARWRRLCDRPRELHAAIQRCIRGGCDYAEAYAVIRGFADAGNTDAMFWVAKCIDTGVLGDSDHGEMLRYLTMGCEENDAQCEIMMGRCCITGNGVDVNVAEGLGWYARAADRGNCVAMLRYNEISRIDQNFLVMVPGEGEVHIRINLDESGDAEMKFVLGSAHINAYGGFRPNRVLANRLLMASLRDGCVQALIPALSTLDDQGDRVAAIDAVPIDACTDTQAMHLCAMAYAAYKDVTSNDEDGLNGDECASRQAVLVKGADRLCHHRQVDIADAAKEVVGSARSAARFQVKSHMLSGLCMTTEAMAGALTEKRLSPAVN